jgi:hypothetical protein
MSDLMAKAKDRAGDHAAQSKDGGDKATDMADEKTGGKLGAANDAIDNAAGDAIDKLAN